jgi:hypothetical protein
VSIEGEFAFTRSVGNFLHGLILGRAVQGEYRFKLKKQMEKRAFVESNREGRWCWLGHVGREMEQQTVKVVKVVGMVNKKGRTGG